MCPSNTDVKFIDDDFVEMDYNLPTCKQWIGFLKKRKRNQFIATSML